MTGIVNANQTTAFAAISVKYPAGSACTCTSGARSLKARGTSGEYIFFVPSAGDWTVSCTNGDKTASRTVSITEEGQTERVEIAYRIYLVQNGAINTDLTGGFASKACKGNASQAATNAEAPKVTQNSTSISLQMSGNWTYGIYITKNLIDLRNYSQVFWDIEAVTISGTNSRYIGGLSWDRSNPSYLGEGAIFGSDTITASVERKTVSADIGAATNAYIGVQVASVGTYRIHNIYLE